ncbi:MAG: cyclophane-forming radical SAM/SPASM peptide maturase YhhB [Nitrosomonas sp.]|nr:cyclophane-forming radical SAM/SPASM peptide maturase YhhB [Nitrosomonas sp.]MDP1950677.1 cyclophane-forming radical SAM/SPASM peptide maturase YhhB [Nitrosomonas sp.]
MIQIDTVLIKVSSRCNINCSYCYVYNMGDDSWEDMPNFISRETISAIAANLEKVRISQTKPFAVVLHGGEPLLLGFQRLKYLLQQLRSVIPDKYCISIQSNGILINEATLDLCSQYRVSISVSLDGPENINNANRVGHKGEGTFSQVIAGLKKLKSHPDSSFLFAGLLAVIEPKSNPVEIYNFFKSTGTKNVDFLYRDGNHDKLPYGKASFDSSEYGTWLQGLVDIYLKDKNPIKIRILDDYIRLILGGRSIKEGTGITDFGIVVIDTDGTITKNDTLKSNFSRADRFSEQLNIKTHELVDVFKSEEFALSHMLQRPTSEKCKTCQELYVCGGGMPLHRWSANSEYNNPSVYCRDQLHIINHIRAKLQHILNENINESLSKNRSCN